MEKPFVGFWWRVLAYFIDGIILAILFVAIGAMVGVSMFSPNMDPTGMQQASGMILLIQIVVPILYFGLMQGSSLQATVGKMAIGAIVTDTDGERMSWGKAIIREVCKIPSGIILMIGYIMIAFTGRKQGLHDIMAGTLVLKKRIVREALEAEA